MMKIGGLQKVSLIDYPGKISAIVFTQGCNFRCPYCHNPELVDPQRYSSLIPSKDLLEFLSVRMGKLDAVTITGGEPTAQGDLAALIRRIRKMDYAIKLDTNGSRPEMLADLLQEKLIDFVAMDVKAPLEKYQNIVGVSVNTDDICRSIRFILKSKIPHEFRTTIVRSQLTPEDILDIAGVIEGAKRYVLQKFQQTKTLADNYFKEKTYSDKEFIGIARKLEKKIPLIIVR